MRIAQRPLHGPQIQGKARIATRGARHARSAQAPIPSSSVSSEVFKASLNRCLGAQKLIDEEFGSAAADHESQIAEEADEQPEKPDQEDRPPPEQRRAQRFGVARRQERERRDHDGVFLPAGEHPRDPHRGHTGRAAPHALHGPQNERRGELQLTEIVQDQRPEAAASGARARRPRAPRPPTASPSAPTYKPPGTTHQNITFWITSRVERTGKQPVQRHERQPDRGQVIHLPDRRPLLGIRRRPAGPSPSRRPASMTRTTGCNKPGPTTSRSAARDSGGAIGDVETAVSAAVRITMSSQARRELEFPGPAWASSTDGSVDMGILAIRGMVGLLTKESSQQ